MPVNQRDGFHKFVIDINTAFSNDETIFTIPANSRYSMMLIVPLAGWDTADIGFEVKMNGDSDTWREVRYQGVPVRSQLVVADKLIIIPAEILAILQSTVRQMRITSIDNGTYNDVNQTVEREVLAYFVS